jgi:hypothetical protein
MGMNANPVKYTDPTGLFSYAGEALGGVTLGAFLVGGATVGYITNNYDPEPLGGFGAGGGPSVPNHTGHSPVGEVIGRLRGFGEGVRQPNTDTEFFPTNTFDSLIAYVFGIYNEQAYDIAYGHAWSDHQHDSWIPLGISSQQELAELIDNIMISGESKEGRNGRIAYWDEDSGVIVIENPNEWDRGTAYRPSDGRNDFDKFK